MTNRRLLIVILTSVLLPFRAAAAEERPAFPEPAILTDVPSPSGSRLVRADSGLLQFKGQELLLNPPGQALFAAAYYADAGALVAVEREGIVSLYQRQSDERAEVMLRRTVRNNAEQGSRTTAVHFARIPGLVYWEGESRQVIETSEPDPSPPRIHFQRIELTPEAMQWHGMWIGDEDQVVLQGCFQPSDRGVWLSPAPGRWLEIETPDPIDMPRNPSHWSSSPVFVFSQGLVVRTRRGWSLHDAGGALVHWFPVGALTQVLFWDAPTVEQGRFLVHARTPHLDRMSYRLDPSIGLLVPVAPSDVEPDARPSSRLEISPGSGQQDML